MGLENKVDIIDVSGDGNCNYYSIAYGCFEKNIDLGNECMKQLQPHMHLRQKMYEHAKNPNVLREIFADEIMRTMYGMESSDFEKDEIVRELTETIDTINARKKQKNNQKWV